MFDTYAATIAIADGQVADESYLRAVRKQVKHPTGPVRLAVSPGGHGVGGLRLVLEQSGIPHLVVFAAHERDSDIALTEPVPSPPTCSSCAAAESMDGPTNGTTAEHRPTAYAASIADGSVLIIDQYDYRHPYLSDEALRRLADHPHIRQTFVVSNGR